MGYYIFTPFFPVLVFAGGLPTRLPSSPSKRETFQGDELDGVRVFFRYVPGGFESPDQPLTTAKSKAVTNSIFKTTYMIVYHTNTAAVGSHARIRPAFLNPARGEGGWFRLQPAPPPTSKVTSPHHRISGRWLRSPSSMRNLPKSRIPLVYTMEVPVD